MARNYRPPLGIRTRSTWSPGSGDTLVFVEVKSRRHARNSAHRTAPWTARNAHALVSAPARDYARRAGVEWERVRFDVVSVVFGGRPKSHYPRRFHSRTLRRYNTRLERLAEEAASLPELRKDPITGRWVIIATDRAMRPATSSASTWRPVRARFCPFCPGNEEKTPPEVLAYRPGGGQPNSTGLDAARGAQQVPRPARGGRPRTGRARASTTR